MIDHTGVNVSNYGNSKAFYLAALAPLGYQLIMELPREIAPEGAMGIGVPPKPDFWMAGGRDNGPPGVRAHYHPNYYGAFVLDPDGHNVEAVFHGKA